MYALTYCFEGSSNSGSYPFGATLAVSYDIEKLRKEMARCVEEDCFQPENEDAQWDDDKNFQIDSQGTDFIILSHRKDTQLYAEYKINKVDVL
jgi:hypothetical protein